MLLLLLFFLSMLAIYRAGSNLGCRWLHRRGHGEMTALMDQVVLKEGVVGVEMMVIGVEDSDPISRRMLSIFYVLEEQ